MCPKETETKTVKRWRLHIYQWLVNRTTMRCEFVNGSSFSRNTDSPLDITYLEPLISSIESMMCVKVALGRGTSIIMWKCYNSWWDFWLNTLQLVAKNLKRQSALLSTELLKSFMRFDWVESLENRLLHKNADDSIFGSPFNRIEKRGRFIDRWLIDICSFVSRFCRLEVMENGGETFSQTSSGWPELQRISCMMLKLLSSLALLVTSCR